MAIGATVIPSYLITEGIKGSVPTTAHIVGSVGPVSTIIQAYFLLQEPIYLWQLIGTATHPCWRIDDRKERLIQEIFFLFRINRMIAKKTC